MRVAPEKRPAKVFGSAATRRILLFLIFALTVIPQVALHSQTQQPSQQQLPSLNRQQQPAPRQPQPPKIAVETKIVTVYASVRDKKGQIVSNLTKDDFAVDEDGRSETITYFARENDLPLNVGLLVDTSLSQRRVLGDERTASSAFIDHIMREEKKDQAFLIHFDREVELLQDLTTSRKKLQSALDLLQNPQQEEVSDNSGNGGRHRGGGTLLYDAVFLASDELMRKQQGRKALIVLSDGVDRGSKETLQTSIEAAQRANTMVYSILFKDEEAYGERGGGGRSHGGWGGIGGPMGGPGGGQRRYPQQREQRPDGKKVLDRISKETGGRLFEVSKKQPVDQIYAQIEQELRDQYILGYVPDKSGTSGDYHKIHLTTKKQDLVVQARDGYYAPPAAAAGQSGPLHSADAGSNLKWLCGTS
jgi:VWFA-related protein